MMRKERKGATRVPRPVWPPSAVRLREGACCLHRELWGRWRGGGGVAFRPLRLGMSPLLREET